MVIELDYASALTPIRTEHGLVVKIAVDRSAYWRKFVETGPLAESKWYNKIVDWLVENYPDEFCLAKSNGIKQ